MHMTTQRGLQESTMSPTSLDLGSRSDRNGVLFVSAQSHPRRVAALVTREGPQTSTKSGRRAGLSARQQSEATCISCIAKLARAPCKNLDVTPRRCSFRR